MTEYLNPYELYLADELTLDELAWDTDPSDNAPQHPDTPEP